MLCISLKRILIFSVITDINSFDKLVGIDSPSWSKTRSFNNQTSSRGLARLIFSVRLLRKIDNNLAAFRGSIQKRNRILAATNPCSRHKNTRQHTLRYRLKFDNSSRCVSCVSYGLSRYDQCNHTLYRYEISRCRSFDALEVEQKTVLYEYGSLSCQIFVIIKPALEHNSSLCTWF